MPWTYFLSYHKCLYLHVYECFQDKYIFQEATKKSYQTNFITAKMSLKVKNVDFFLCWRISFFPKEILLICVGILRKYWCMIYSNMLKNEFFTIYFLYSVNFHWAAESYLVFCSISDKNYSLKGLKQETDYIDIMHEKVLRPITMT